MTTAGSANAPAVLLHGFTGSSDGWTGQLLSGLRGAGVTARAMDLPGHGSRQGEGDLSECTLEAALATVDAAVDGVAALIGYSMGGRIALQYAARHPGRVSRLVLESASPGLATARERSDRRRADRALADAIEAEGIEAFVDRWSELPLFETQRTLHADTRAALRERRLRNDPGALAAALRGLGTGSLPSLWDRLEDFPVPTLLLTGARDEKFVEIADRMSERMPDGRHITVAEVGHCVHLEDPDAWIATVSTFLTASR